MLYIISSRWIFERSFVKSFELQIFEKRDGFKVFSSKPIDRFLTTPNNKKLF